MILTVTPNPSLDRTLRVPVVEVGEVLRATSTRVDAGGKGINVSRALCAQGATTQAVFPVGGADGAQLVTLLAASALAVEPVNVGAATRSNVTLVDDSGATTKINAAGEPLTAGEVEALLGAVRSAVAVTGATTVVGAGSLPDGVDIDFYVRLGQLCAAAGARLVLDTSGEPLVQAVKAGAPHLVKPNEKELAELVGHDLRTVGEVVVAAREVIAQGAAEVLVSLGPHGALLVSATQSWWAGGTALVPMSTVGAGDVTLAGYLHDGDAAPAERLRTAVAWGRAAVRLPGSAVPDASQIHLDDVRVVEAPNPTTAVEEL